MLLRNVLALVGGVAMLFWIDTRLAAAMLLVIPPLVLAAAAWGRTIRRLSRESQGKLAGASGTLGEGLGAIDTVQAFTREEHEAARYREAVEDAFVFMEKRVGARSTFMAGTSLLAMGTLAGIFWLGAHRVVGIVWRIRPLKSPFFLSSCAAINTHSGVPMRIPKRIIAGSSTASDPSCQKYVPMYRSSASATPRAVKKTVRTAIRIWYWRFFTAVTPSSQSRVADSFPGLVAH